VDGVAGGMGSIALEDGVQAVVELQLDQPENQRRRQRVGMQQAAGGGILDGGAILQDERRAQGKLVGVEAGTLEAAAGSERDQRALGGGGAHRLANAGRDAALGIEQGAVTVDGEQQPRRGSVH
jgi:hypothetical protein